MKNEQNRIKMKSMDKDSQVIRLLKSAYEKSGKTHVEIAQEIEASQPFISKIFSGRQYASLAMLVKIGITVGLEPKQVTAVYKKDKIAEIDSEIAEILDSTK